MRRSSASCRSSSAICRSGSRKGARIIIVFEGRDAAGKGGTIKALTERVSPRVFRVVALPAPSDREKTQIFMQRYIEHFPAAGEIVIFDRSWYNRAGVEYVMGFCAKEQHKRFLELCPRNREVHRRRRHHAHQDLAGGGQEEQEKRGSRADRRSAAAMEAEPDGYRVVRALVRLFPGARHDAGGDRQQAAPWHIVRSDDKRRARLNCISHILDAIPYKKVSARKVKLPKRSNKGEYDDQASLKGRNFVAEKYWIAMSLDRLINILVTITLIEMMVLIGLRVTFAEARPRRRKLGVWSDALPWANYLLVPAVAVGLLVWFDANPMVAAGFLILAVCPGAPFGPPFAGIARANVPIAVGLMVILAGSSAVISPPPPQPLPPRIPGGATSATYQFCEERRALLHRSRTTAAFALRALDEALASRTCGPAAWIRWSLSAKF